MTDAELKAWTITLDTLASLAGLDELSVERGAPQALRDALTDLIRERKREAAEAAR